MNSDLQVGHTLFHSVMTSEYLKGKRFNDYKKYICKCIELVRIFSFNLLMRHENLVSINQENTYQRFSFESSVSSLLPVQHK